MTTSNKKLIVLRGTPGSGKSFFTKTHFSDARVCSADFYFNSAKNGYQFDATKLHLAHKYCMDTFLNGIKFNERTMVIDNTNILKKHYKEYVAIAKENGYDVYQVVLTGNYKNVHGVPDEKVEEMRSKFQVDDDLPHWVPEK